MDRARDAAAGTSRGYCSRARGCSARRTALPPADRNVGRGRHAGPAAALVGAGGARQPEHDRGRRRRRGRRARPRLPHDLAALCARPPGARLRVVRVCDRADRALRPRFPEGICRRPLPGNDDFAARLDRRSCRPRHERCVRLLGQRPDAAAAAFVGERVLQPECRARVRPRAAVDGRTARDARLASRRRRARPAERRAGTQPIRPHRLDRSARRQGDRDRRGPRDRAAAYAGRAGGDRLSRQRCVPGRLVGTASHLHAAPLPRRQCDRHGCERRQAVLAAADGDGRRPERDVRAGRRRPPDRAAAAEGRRLPRHLHGRSDRGAGSRPPREHGRPPARRALRAVLLPRSVRIAYDVTPLSHPRTGVGNYILGALRGMLENGGDHELVAFGPVSMRGRKLLNDALTGLDVERRIVSVPFAHATRRVWGRVQHPVAERFVGALDVLHFSDWMRPPQRAGIRATMIHDLGPLHFPERLHPRTVRMHTTNAREARNCDVVFVNSQFTAADVVKRLGIEPDRVHVAHPGVAPVFTPDGPGFDAPFIFSTATADWRKNLHNLQLAYELLQTDLPLFTLSQFPRPLSDDHLARFYRGATVFVYPSYFEGFGRSGKLSTLARDGLWCPFALGRRRDGDVLHCPTYRGPLRSALPLVVTVHDLAVLRHPDAFNRWTRTYSPRVVPRVLAAARRIIAVSEFTRRELVELLRVPD